MKRGTGQTHWTANGILRGLLSVESAITQSSQGTYLYPH